MTRSLALLATIALGGCSAQSKPAPVAQAPLGSATPVSSALPPDPVSSPPPVAAGSSSVQTTRVRAALAKVAVARALAPTKEVPGVSVDRPALLARLRAHVEREVPKQAIDDEGATYALLGMIPPKYDYEGATYKLLEAQIAGYYEPADGQMILAADLEDEAARATLAHELVHALQDQHFDLRSRMKWQPGHADAQAALQCLAEGDATSAMFDVMMAGMKLGKMGSVLDMPDEMLLSQLRMATELGPGSEAPRVMREGLVAPYADGLVFVNRLRRKGGWSEVDAAWRSLPTTTEQILHEDKFASREPAIEVAPPTFTSLGAGFVAQTPDSYGELGLRTALGEWLDEEASAQAASHWGGDRGLLARRGDVAAFAWRVRYDEAAPKSDGYAERAFSIASVGMHKALGAPKKRTVTLVCFEPKGRAPLALARKGRDLVWLAGPARGTEMAPAGDCAVLEKWAAEALK